MIRIRERNINLLPGFWEETWKNEPPWRPGFGIDPVRFRAMAAMIEPGDCVLDVGGGRGEFLEWLREFGPPAVTRMIEYSAAGVAAAALKGVSATQGSCYALPYHNGIFDVVICAELIEHLEDIPACIAELKRVCKPGGWVTITTPNELRIEDRQHIWSISAADVSELLGAGAEVIEVGNHLTGYWRKPNV